MADAIWEDFSSEVEDQSSASDRDVGEALDVIADALTSG